jgi:AAHS family 4-hydroxybenzoate transporter-like MFS transporter
LATQEDRPGARRYLSLVLLACVYVLDGFDLNAMAIAVPRLQGALGLEPASFGWVFSALLIGMGAAAALIAPLGDRFGRRPLIVFGVLGVAVSTLGTATADSVTEFLLWRLITGAGLGTCLPNVTAMSAELAPARLRATVMSVASAGIPLGLFAAGYFAPEIVGFGGWPALFVAPGLFAAALTVLLGLVLPKVRPVARKIGAKVPQAELLRPPARFPFIIFAGALALNAINLYMVNSWLPTVLPQAGFNVDAASRLAGTVQLAGLGLAIVLSLLVDRWRPAPTMIATFAVMAASFLAIGLTEPDPQRWRWLLMVGVGGASAAGLALPALTPYLFPPRLLSSAIGMGVLVGRVGAIGGPLVGQAMLTAHVAPRAFLAAAAVPAGLAMLFCLGIPAALAMRRREEDAG